MPSVVVARHGGDDPAPVCLSPSDRFFCIRRLGGHSGAVIKPFCRLALLLLPTLLLLAAGAAWAQTGEAAGAHAGGEASLIVPPLDDPNLAKFFGVTGHFLLMFGL